MRIKRIIDKYPITSYLITMFFLTWLCWGLIYASAQGVIGSGIYKSRMTIYDNSFSTFIFIGGSMPSVLAVVFTGITKGRKGIKELLSRLIAWKANPFWYVFVLIFNFLIMYLPYLICNLFGGSFDLSVNTRLLMPLYFLIAIVFWGPLGEELGWRGYVQPGLRKKLSLLPTGAIIGAVWGLWHLPLFFIPGSSQYGSSILGFLISDIALGVVFTWVYERTGGSLLISCLFHAAWNFTNALIIVRPAAADMTKYLIISNIIYVVLLIFIVIDMYRKKKANTVKT